MGVSLKIENEELCGKEYADKGRRRRAARFHRHRRAGFQMANSPIAPARLTHGLKPVTVVWLLRCSVLRETPTASAIHLQKLNCYDKFYFVIPMS
jgi:hypothetical protein